MQRSDYPNADLPYVLYTPDDLSAQDKWQLIVFLHGRGERGADLELARKWGVPKYLDAGHDLSAMVYVPQCPLEHENWVPIAHDVLTGIDAIQAKYSISNVHITGFSMGGHGTHFLAINHPERFTSVAPVATYMYPDYDITGNACVLVNTPVWIFHSASDWVPVAHSEGVVETLRACDATQLKFTRYEDADHTQTADLAYSNEELYKWMLK